MSEVGALRSWIDELHEILRIPDETYREDSLTLARERMQELEDWKALALTRGAHADIARRALRQVSTPAIPQGDK